MKLVQAMSDTRQHVHELIDRLPPAQLEAVAGLLESMVDAVEDRDILSHAERKAIAEADEWLKHNQAIPHEDVLADFGLTTGDWEKMGQDTPPDQKRRRSG